MIVLDTNVLSALMRATPDASIAAWLDTFSAGVVWTTSVSVFEISFGIELLPEGRRRAALERSFSDVMETDLNNRVLAFDTRAAALAGKVAAVHRRAGRAPDVRDVQIAAIALAHQATVATRNVRHFEGIGLALVDPWSA